MCHIIEDIDNMTEITIPQIILDNGIILSNVIFVIVDKYNI